MKKQLVLNKKIVLSLTDDQKVRIKGGATFDFYCDLDTVNPCTGATILNCPTKNCATNDPYGTQCCSADLEICNTNSDPYCTAC